MRTDSNLNVILLTFDNLVINIDIYKDKWKASMKSTSFSIRSEK